jgi:hypothetical protein
MLIKMNKNYRLFHNFEKDLLRSEKVNIYRNFKIYEELYREAVALGVWPLNDPIEGIENIIRIAKVVNSVSKSA